jgi:hypothetical protein
MTSRPPPASLDLNAAFGKGRKVMLSWTATSDNIVVTGYRLFRDGIEVGVTQGTTYTDALAGKITTHAYYLVAYDGAGNVSGPFQPGLLHAVTDALPAQVSTGVDKAHFRAKAVAPTRRLNPRCPSPPVNEALRAKPDQSCAVRA